MSSTEYKHDETNAINWMAKDRYLPKFVYDIRFVCDVRRGPASRKKTMTHTLPQNTNYQIWLDETIEALDASGKKPTLLLQACCAPCSSYVLEYLFHHFDITVFFYNPNISSKEEFDHRSSELRRLMHETGMEKEVVFVEGAYEPEKFAALAEGKENLPEGGARCYDCYGLRLKETAKYAKEHGFDYFSTTLSVSPHKNAKWLNEIGANLSQQYEIDYLYGDFKKKDGYKKSVELSKEHDLYRQDYCGCTFSRIQAEKRHQGR